MGFVGLLSCVAVLGGPGDSPRGVPALVTDAASARDDYEALRAVAGPDADAQVSLALWCERRGLMAERARHLALALQADPGHARARALLGFVRDGVDWGKPEKIARRDAEDPGRAALLADYEARRAAVEDTADAHFRLARWCESNGLADQARAHDLVAVKLNPRFDEAWKALGRRKHQGRWMTEAEIAIDRAEEQAQREADRQWSRKLDRWKAETRSKNSEVRRRAEAALAEVEDPRATPSVVKVFFGGRSPDPVRGVQLLGQIDDVAASLALANLALAHPSPDVRGLAAKTLHQRDPREFAGPLIERIAEEVRYRVQPVGGPGQPGSLVIEGREFDTRRVYAPPPVVSPGTRNSRVFLGPDGQPIILSRQEASRVNRGLVTFSTITPETHRMAAMLSALSGLSGTGIGVDSAVNPILRMTPQERVNGGGQVGELARAADRTQRMVAEAQTAAVVAQQQLANDVAALDHHNAAVREWNERILTVLEPVHTIRGKVDRESLREWHQDLLGRKYSPQPQTVPYKRTFVQNVPLAYVPRPVDGFRIGQTGYEGPRRTLSASGSCFAAGTLVATRGGLLPIESLIPGDLVLSQATSSGTLAYHPVVAVYHNPPAETLRIDLGGDAVIATTIHRFWKAGEGWVMACDLKPGDLLRTSSGLAQVQAIEPAGVRPVFNLDVAETGTFFVAQSGLLVRDNTLPDFRTRPFDAVELSVAALNSQKR